MFVRRRRPLMRAAMVGGAGYYAGKKMQEGREEEATQDTRIDQLESQQGAPSAPEASGGISGNTIDQLKQLGELRDQGILTDEEFDAQKQKLLQGS